MSEGLINRLGRWIRLNADEIAMVRDLPGEIISADRGDHLPTDVSPGSAVLMLDCWSARTRDSSNGRRVITEFVLPGELILFDEFTARIAATAILSRGRFQIVPPQAMADLQQSDALSQAIDWLLAIRQSIRSEWLVNIAARKAHQRLAHLLCEMHARINAAGMVIGGCAEMPLTQTDLAAALAMSSVHLNIELQKLRSSGLVDLREKHLYIRNRLRLEALAGFDGDYLLQWPTRLPERRNLLSDDKVTQERRRAIGTLY